MFNTKNKAIMGKIHLESVKTVFYRLKAILSQEIYKLSFYTCGAMFAYMVLNSDIESDLRVSLAFLLAILGTLFSILFVMGNYKKNRNIVKWSLLPLLIAMVFVVISNLWGAVVLIIQAVIILSIRPDKLEREADNMC